MELTTEAALCTVVSDILTTIQIQRLARIANAFRACASPVGVVPRRSSKRFHFLSWWCREPWPWAVAVRQPHQRPYFGHIARRRTLARVTTLCEKTCRSLHQVGKIGGIGLASHCRLNTCMYVHCMYVRACVRVCWLFLRKTSDIFKILPGRTI